MCALFCILGGVGLNNRLFRKKSAKSKAKKLEMVLRRLTRGTMTVEQTRQLQSVLGYRRQYQMQVCSSKQTFRSAVAPSQDVEEKKMVLTLLDGKETTLTCLPDMKPKSSMSAVNEYWQYEMKRNVPGIVETLIKEQSGDSTLF